MDPSHILDALNQPQREAVTSEANRCLIVAGAGSGKTRVLVHRIAWLLETKRASSADIFAVTFTNKAAGQMRSRIEHMLGRSMQGMWVGTFHGMAHRMLRLNWQAAKLEKSFQILDSEDQLRCIRLVLGNMELGEDRWPPRQIQSYINTRKDEGLRPQHLPRGADYWSDKMIDVYTQYQAYCDQKSIVDFPELLLRCFELLRNNDDLREQYQQRFKHLLIDEFQDTNTIQYAWIRLLTSDTVSLFAVGDDDQAIYGWRGAKLENILKFSDDFASVNTVRLEQNYRSTKTILHAANKLIAHNQRRMGKNLWADGVSGEPITVYAAINDLDEAHFVIAQLKNWLANGGSLDQCTILYRISSQSRVLEDSLQDARIPYRIQGGFRFYERLEIKSALAYLRLMTQLDDNVAFERIVNFPARGIGARTAGQVRIVANEHKISMWEAAKTVIAQRMLPARSCNALTGFLALIESLRESTQTMSLADKVRTMLDKSQILGYLNKEKSERVQNQLDNLQELISAADQFEKNLSEVSEPLVAYLSHAVLETGSSLIDLEQKGVNLMTMHAAKGLEFDVVFICGLEEGLSPHSRSSGDTNKIEEERRLCYVGMTRAKQKLFLTHTQVRHLNCSDYYPSPSRFLRELPVNVLDMRSPENTTEALAPPAPPAPLAPPAALAPPAPPALAEAIPVPPPEALYCKSGKRNSDKSAFHLGQIVAHPRFGQGVVLMYQGTGSETRIQVKFDSVGCKWLLQSFAKLSPIEAIAASGAS